MSTKSISENLRRYRKKGGYSQEKLAELTGISKMSIRRYEAGDRQPKLETLEKIATALGIDTWELCEGYELKTDMLNEANKQSKFLSYLDSLGYEFVDGSHYDAPFDEVGLIHIKKENLDIPLTQKDFDTLENSIKDDISLEIYRLRKEKGL